MTRKTWHHRVHAKVTHSSENLFLQFFLLLMPVFGQRARPSLHVAHSVPCKESRSAKVVISLRLCHVKVIYENLTENAFLAIECQWQVDTTQCHPIQFPLPPGPIPPDHRVRHCAHILVVPKSLENISFRVEHIFTNYNRLLVLNDNFNSFSGHRQGI